ncbi:hypothetical protein ACTXT7_014065 [Hymenolepis weldensis]
MDSIKTAKIAAIIRCIIEQMDLSKPDKDHEDYIKNVDEFHYEPSVGEIFTTWYARDVDDQHAAAEVQQINHYLYLAYLLPLSPKDLTFEETIENARRCLAAIPLFSAVVNRMCNAFSYGSLKED